MLECLLLICVYTNAKFIVICKPRALNDGMTRSTALKLNISGLKLVIHPPIL